MPYMSAVVKPLRDVSTSTMLRISQLILLVLLINIFATVGFFGFLGYLKAIQELACLNHHQDLAVHLKEFSASVVICLVSLSTHFASSSQTWLSFQQHPFPHRIPHSASPNALPQYSLLL